MLKVATLSRSTEPPCLRSNGNAAGDRQHEREGRAGTVGRLHPDAAAVMLDDVTGDGETEAGPAGFAPASRPVHLVEPLEDAVLSSLRDADTVVLDGGHDRVALGR